jgi:hypothetical protein
MSLATHKAIRRHCGEEDIPISPPMTAPIKTPFAFINLLPIPEKSNINSPVIMHTSRNRITFFMISYI